MASNDQMKKKPQNHYLMVCYSSLMNFLMYSQLPIFVRIWCFLFENGGNGYFLILSNNSKTCIELYLAGKRKRDRKLGLLYPLHLFDSNPNIA